MYSEIIIKKNIKNVQKNLQQNINVANLIAKIMYVTINKPKQKKTEWK